MKSGILDAVTKEETKDWSIRVGTTYHSLSKNGGWGEFVVAAFKENEIFELTSEDGRNHVRYAHFPIGQNSIELEYYE
jgi:hypothetical protein